MNDADDVGDEDDIIHQEQSYSEQLERKLTRQKRVAAKECREVYVNLDIEFLPESF
jgi:hypothetical protein